MTNYLTEGIIIKTHDGKEEIINIPYNPTNILINEYDIIKILNKVNININKINDIELFRQAFTHKSYCKKDIFPQHILDLAKIELGNNDKLIELRDKSYERLEFLGDRVLKIIVSNYLYSRYPNQDEGFMTKLQTKIEDKKSLYLFSKELGLNKYFIISKQIESMNGRNLEKIHEDIFESFIGALFISEGKGLDLTICTNLITYLLETLIDYSEKLYCDNNYKDILLRYHHQRKWNPPIYVCISSDGPAHKKRYLMGVEKIEKDSINKNNYNDLYIGFGTGSSKKEGEQNAAKMALIKYNILKKDQYTDNDLFYPDLVNNEGKIYKNSKIINNLNDSDSESNYSINSEKTI